MRKRIFDHSRGLTIVLAAPILALACSESEFPASTEGSGNPATGGEPGEGSGGAPVAASGGSSLATDSGGNTGVGGLENGGGSGGMVEPSPPITIEFQYGAYPDSSYAGVTDTTLTEGATSTNHGSVATCEVDGDDGGGTDKSCVISWDVSAIPKGMHVHAVKVTLEVVNGSGNSYSIVELLRPFAELEATWSASKSGVAWDGAGASGAADRGNFVASVSGGTGSITVYLNEKGVEMVQAWVDGTRQGGILISDTASTDGLDFASSQAENLAHRPKLTVTYGPTPRTSGPGKGTIAPEENLLVAFIGDQGNNGNSDEVLQLIKSEGAVATVHNGDFDYQDNPAAWDARINSILGEDYPYFSVIGNHDANAWEGDGGYASYIAQRHARVSEMACTGELGVRSSCTFRGLHMVYSCIGTNELREDCGANSSTQLEYIYDSLQQDDHIWSICNFHKNQHDMQVGGKSDEVGWSVYQICMNAGAFVATGHEHSYSRTLSLNEVGNRGAGHGAYGLFDLLKVKPGSNFVFVSGLAGAGRRDYEGDKHDDDTWWASLYADNRWVKNGALMSGVSNYGALFIRFHVDNDPKKAIGYFKDIDGRLVDEFTISMD